MLAEGLPNVKYPTSVVLDLFDRVMRFISWGTYAVRCCFFERYPRSSVQGNIGGLAHV